MNWNSLTSVDQLLMISEESFQQPVVIFKHSTRCSISRAALDRLERNWKGEELPSAKTYFLDLLEHRDISNTIASQWEVEHESPQLIVIKNNKAVYFKSHFDIEYNKVKDALRALSTVAAS